MKQKSRFEEALADPACTKFEAVAMHAIFGAFLFALVSNEPYKPLVAFLVAMPWLEIAARRLSEADLAKSKAAEALFIIAFLMPTFSLAFIAIQDVKHDLDWTKAIVPGICVGLLLTAVAVRSSNRISRNKSDAIFIGVLCVTHGILATGLLNCLLDHSTPTTYTAKILAGHASSTGRGYYYLTVSPWGTQSKASEIRVAYDVYHGTALGDTICIRSRRGAFLLTWTTVQNCSPDEIRGAASRP